MRRAFDVHTGGTYHQINGIRLHCIEAGPKDGPLAILLHGFPEFWWGWRYQIGPLADAGFRVLVPDQRGYHLSDKPQGRRAYHIDILAQDVIGLADALGCERFNLVGHDWGGVVAWWVAIRYPHRVARLAIANAPHPSVVGPYMKSHPSQMLKSLYAGFFQLPFLPEALLTANHYRALKQALQRTSRLGIFSDADLELYEKTWSAPDALTCMLNWYRALPLAPRHPPEDRLLMPVRVIWGVRDHALERGLAEKSLALCADGQVRWMEKATHWVHLEEPDVFNAEMLNFLEHPQSAGDAA